MEYFAVILAGGSGSRMGHHKRPKQFLEINNKPIIVHTIIKFLAIKNIDNIIISCHLNWIDFTKKTLQKYFNDKEILKIWICKGGATRNKSIINGIYFIKETFKSDDAIIISHDSVRPFVALETIKANIAQSELNLCIGTSVPVVNTIIESIDGINGTAVPLRNTLFQAMTPQTFSMKTFQNLYNKIKNDNFSDVCGLFIHFKYSVKLVIGKPQNFKITTEHDLIMAKLIIENDRPIS